MGEIRFVGTGKTRGYPYLVCKKKFSIKPHIVSICMGFCQQDITSLWHLNSTMSLSVITNG